MDYTHHYQSPLGGITIASDGEGLSGLWFDGQKFFASTLGCEHMEKALPIFDKADAWLDLYFRGIAPEFTPQLSLHATLFRKMIWDILQTIPYGQTTTYAAIARQAANQLGRPGMSAQAVGGAIAHNPISLIIPCHRVVGTDGSMTGYAGGIERKRSLLTLEQTKRITPESSD